MNYPQQQPHYLIYRELWRIYIELRLLFIDQEEEINEILFIDQIEFFP
jgi:hypothetical protein